MEKLPNEALYSSFAYHVALLQDFSATDAGPSMDSAGRKRRPSIKRSNSFAGKILKSGGGGFLIESTGSVRSTQSLGTRRGNPI